MLVKMKSDNEDLEKRYPNVKCTLTSENLGMGNGNNLGIKLTASNNLKVSVEEAQEIKTAIEKYNK